MSGEQNEPLVLALDDATATLERVGGKGASLARLVAAGLPVPRGFHVTTAAYRRFVAHNALQEEILAAVSTVSANQPATLAAASTHIASLFARGVLPDDVADAIRRAYAELGSDLPVAVRSSATAEDLPEMSFAGQQETYLNMHGEAMVLDAVKHCWASLWTGRAIAYRAHHRIAPQDVSLAVVVQELVPAAAAGILFTENPLTGARDQIVIDASWGLGDAVVAGKVTPDAIVIDRASQALIEQRIGNKAVMTVLAPEGTHDEQVPLDRSLQPALNPAQATALASIGLRIESLYGEPVDVEWAIADGRIAILQARPVTADPGRRVPPEEWNDSLACDCLWTSSNLGEAVPGVMTPCTWSLLQVFMAQTLPALFVSCYQPMGNIGGRFYMNLSVTATLGAAFGIRRERFLELNEEAFGRIPDDVEIPLLPVSRWTLLRSLLPAAVRLRGRVSVNQRRLPAFLASAPARCEALRARIQAAPGTLDLYRLWQTDLAPYFLECCRMLEAGARRDGNAAIVIRHELRKLVDDADANALLSGLSGRAGQLASLGPLLGLAQLSRGEIDRATFARRYGHRGPEEFEVSLPRPAEEPGWIDRQLAGLRESPVDAATLLARQDDVRSAAWERFCQRYPGRAEAMRRRIDQAAAAFRDREAARSEVARVFWALRDFVRHAGSLTGHGEALFLLTIDEILAVLGGSDAPLAHVPARRTTYERYSGLPPYSALIRGPFDPFQWAADPQHRTDLFDAWASHAPKGEAITGFPAATGIAEGRVRVVATAGESDQLKPGEVLVTTVTNVGWTPLFPRVAAVVTDVGAPLSHAAIVARELGIPAVVGCGNATMRLHTGDWVRVDGGRGTVGLLRRVE